MNLWNEIWFVAIWTFNIGFAAVDAYITFGIIGFTTMQPCFSSVLFTKLATYFLKTISTTWNDFIWYDLILKTISSKLPLLVKVIWVLKHICWRALSLKQNVSTGFDSKWLTEHYHKLFHNQWNILYYIWSRISHPELFHRLCHTFVHYEDRIFQRK